MYRIASLIPFAFCMSGSKTVATANLFQTSDFFPTSGNEIPEISESSEYRTADSYTTLEGRIDSGAEGSTKGKNLKPKLY